MLFSLLQLIPEGPISSSARVLEGSNLAVPPFAWLQLVTGVQKRSLLLFFLFHQEFNLPNSFIHNQYLSPVDNSCPGCWFGAAVFCLPRMCLLIRRSVGTHCGSHTCFVAAFGITKRKTEHCLQHFKTLLHKGCLFVVAEDEVWGTWPPPNNKSQGKFRVGD